jgi:ABC-2 type transport system permease protein
MTAIQSLLKPRILVLLRHRLSIKKKVGLSFFAGIGLMIWTIIYYVSYRVLNYFKHIESIGDYLSFKLLSMILLTLFSLLIFSAILTVLSKLFLSKDLGLVNGLPIPSETVFLARWIESTFDSSWMMLLYTFPVFIAYGIVFKAYTLYIIFLFLSLIPLAMIANGFSSMIVMPVVLILPASRIRSIFVFLGLGVFIILYIGFRIMQPERFVNPDGFASVILYLRSISMPSSPLFPSTWVFDALKSSINAKYTDALFHVCLLWSCGLLFVCINTLIARFIYFKGYSKSQTAQSRLITGKNQWLYKVMAKTPGPVRAIFIKEMKTFWRDQTQWTQLFLIGALIVIYLYNFSVLPFEKSPINAVYIENLFSFLNIALASFVLTAIGARFVFPSISHEGMSFWIIQSSPVTIKTYLWIKWLCYFLPLFLLSEILIVLTNILLHVNWFMMILSVVTIAFISPGVVALGIGLGAAYPDFKSENPTQTVTGFGGLMYMFCASAFFGSILLLETYPVYLIFNAHFKRVLLKDIDAVIVIICFFSCLFICLSFLFIPMWFGESRLKRNVQARNTEKFDFHEENMLMLSDSETETRRSILLSRVYKIKSGQASRYPAKNIIEEIQSCH